MANRNMITKSMAAAVASSNSKITASVDQVQLICESLLAHVLEEVKTGKDVAFTNFLKFKRVLNKARTFRRPGVVDNFTNKPDRYSLSVKVMTNTKVMFESLPVDADADADEESKSEHEDEEPKAKAKAKGKKAKKDSESEPEPEPVVKPKGKKAKKEESDSESEHEEEPKAKAKGKKAKKPDSEPEPEHEPVVKPKGKVAKKSDSEAEPVVKPKPKGKAKKGAITNELEIEPVPTSDGSEDEFMFD